jgi:hypothetical protein
MASHDERDLKPLAELDQLKDFVSFSVEKKAQKVLVLLNSHG